MTDKLENLLDKQKIFLCAEKLKTDINALFIQAVSGKLFIVIII